jgi:hypothetical protein
MIRQPAEMTTYPQPLPFALSGKKGSSQITQIETQINADKYEPLR